MAIITQFRVAGLVVGIALLALPASAQAPRQQSYPVSSLEIEYVLPHPRHPEVRELLDLEVEMRVTRGGLMQPHPVAERTRFRLGAIPPGTRFWTTGLQYLTRQLLAEFERRDIGGVIITLPDLEEGSGADLRPPGDTRLRVRIWTGRVETIATVADGSRFRGSLDERTNLPEHDWVRRGSPVQAGGEDALIDARAIEDYGRRLSRHVGRRIDARLRPGRAPGTTRLEYHVAETKPWLAYANYSNTGTRATGHARERFGFAHYQLSGRDDILRIDYSTGNFDQVHGVFGSYDTPLDPGRRVRLRAFGSWSRYDRSELGDTTLDDIPAFSGLEFSGEQWEGGARLGGEVVQAGPLFFDLFASARWREVSVDNENSAGQAVFAEGHSQFLLPGGGARVFYDDSLTRFELETRYEANLPGVARTRSSDLVDLGRLGADRDFQLLSWNGELSFYIEPILWYRRGFGDPGSAARSTLAHEVQIRTAGQWTFGDRLVPQFEQIAGGLHTVRGYRQAAAAGDTAAIGTVEYRLHLARLLDPGGEPVEVPVLGPFSYRPRTVFSRADWDLILKLFYDAAVVREEAASGQGDAGRLRKETLAAWGIGAELLLMRHLRAGIDLGFRRSGLSDGTRAGISPRTHLYVTITY